MLWYFLLYLCCFEQTTSLLIMTNWKELLICGTHHKPKLWGYMDIFPFGTRARLLTCKTCLGTRINSTTIYVLCFLDILILSLSYVEYIFCYKYEVFFCGIFIHFDNMILYFEWYVSRCGIIQFWYWYSYIIFRFEKWWGRWDTSSVTDMRYIFCGIFIHVDNMILYFEWYVSRCGIIQFWYWYSYIIFRFET